mmetsp:Transcript_11840/g.21036  ORF Transcript_11840/g.21036 Transcript_11840/m.21036 type:complete len:91 (-) Transcript_11840:1362-1634(-)
MIDTQYRKDLNTEYHNFKKQQQSQISPPYPSPEAKASRLPPATLLASLSILGQSTIVCPNPPQNEHPFGPPSTPTFSNGSSIIINTGGMR